ncbi:hypothetical protein OIU93_05380 [Paeniglutamicibacter sp. ZC-3]|uniref:hypothetical protein n=1 Tax=Paeniglutamicibacter sp. ZC-3 TaxID=2986919 RepID=UPI0021F6D4BA|nr:hypothetical protein [Paeniglutamicibacter sp. ZC-3]MCV9993733.1 hypothetical protein [Paeniglutamicibacter sp. ZC-3]
MSWIAWALLVSVIPLGIPRYFADSGFRWPLKQSTTSYLLVAVLGLAGLAAAIGDHLPAASSIPHELVVVASVAAATLGGGPVTETVFRLAAFKRKAGDDASEEVEPSPLRGGMWIGLLERAAIASTLWASWPEGLAVVLAVKGLGRFSELKQHAAAEQFILGTFVSVLWACAAVGVGRIISL